jgi:hypothetical protein
MLPSRGIFDRSILEQIALNQARTPTQRMQALCDLLDAARAMAPKDPESRARRVRAQTAREQNREQLRAQLRRLIAAQRADAPERL